MCDGFVIEKLVLKIWPQSLMKQRSYHNSKHLGEKTAIVIFGPLNPKFADFLDFQIQIL